MPPSSPDPAASNRNRPSRIGQRRWLAIGFGVLGLGAIFLWVAGWVASYRQDQLIIARSSWVPPLPMIAGDFTVHIDHVARLQAAGVDPYHKFDDWVCFTYPYPPMVARCFAWVVFFSTPTAAFFWQGALGLIVGAGGLAAFLVRRELGLDLIPRSLIIAALLFATPTVFAIERGQSDPMIILPIIASVWLLRRKASGFGVVAGALLGLTAWLKYYPGLAAVALVTPDRWKALAAFIGVVLLVGVIDFDGVRESVRHARQIQTNASAVRHPVNEATHSIIENWQNIKFVRRSPWLRVVPAPLAAGVLLLPAIALVSRRMAQSPRRDTLLLPFFLWLVSAATFALPYSNDYNLVPLPIAALAVWDRRDRWQIHLAILLSILWSQPFRLPLSGDLLLGLKLAALYGVAASLIAKTSWALERSQDQPDPMIATVEGDTR